MGDILKKKARDSKARRLRKENVKSILKWYNAGPNNNITGYCKSGELFAFLGPIAKEVGIIEELAGLSPERNGSAKVFFDDTPISEADTIYIDVQCADILYENVTVLETLAYSAELRVREKTHASELTALRLLKEMGLKDIADRRVGQILTWQRRMLLLATQVAAECGIIFFDNPTKDLDASSAVAMIRAMQNLVRSGDNVTNILVVSINSITFREYVRLDRVQLLLRFSGVQFSPSHGAVSGGSEDEGGGGGDGGVSYQQASGPGAAEVQLRSSPEAVGASSIYFGPGSSALTYFVRLGRIPTPGASISDFLMDLVDTVRASELIALESEYRRDLGMDPTLFQPSDGVGVGAGVDAGNAGGMRRSSPSPSSRSLFTGGRRAPEGQEREHENEHGLDLTPRRRGRRSASRLGLENASEHEHEHEHDNSRSFMPFSQSGRQLDENGLFLQQQPPPRPSRSSSSLAGTGRDSDHDRDRDRDGPGASSTPGMALPGGGARWQQQQQQGQGHWVDALSAHFNRVARSCMSWCYDEDKDEFEMPFVGTQLLWCLWRAFAVRWRDTRNVLTLWLVSGVLVALGLSLCSANSLSLDMNGVYHRLVLLTLLPYLLVIVGCMWNVDDYKDKAVFVYERTRGFYSASVFFPFSSLVADICVYRLVPPLIAALILYPAVAMQWNHARMAVFVELVLLISLAGACLSKAVLNALSAVSSLNSAKIAMVTCVLVTTLMMGGICPNLGGASGGGSGTDGGFGHLPRDGRSALEDGGGGGISLALNATSALGVLENTQNYFPLKQVSFLYKV